MRKLLVLIAAGVMSVSSLASSSLGYSGRLVQPNGEPVSGTPNIRFDISSTFDPSDILCSKTVNGVPLSQGIFSVELEFDPSECEGNTFDYVMSSVPSGHNLTYQVTDLTNLRSYAIQTIHSVPYSYMANFAKSLGSMGATISGQVLKWDAGSSQWIPGSVGTGDGSVTTINTGSGLAGGPITTTGTIYIPAGGVLDSHLVGSINPSKLDGVRDGTMYLRGDNTWATLKTDIFSQILTTFTEITGSAVTNTDTVIDAFGKLQGQVTDLQSGKLDKTGGTLSVGTIDGVPPPVTPNQIVNKQYVDDQITNINESQWSTSAPNIYYNTGNVGIGTSIPNEKLEVTGNAIISGKIRFKDSGTNYVEFQAPASTTGVTFTLPANAGSNGYVLKTDGTGVLSWGPMAIDSSSITDGSIVNADISPTAAIEQSKIAGLTTDLGNKEPAITGGTTAQYWRGDKTWQDLEAAVRGTDLAGFAASTGTVAATDTVLSALGKLAGNQGNYVEIAGDTMSGNLNMGGNTVTNLAAPVASSDAATKQYVDSFGQWQKSSGNVYRSTGNVGIGTSTMTSLLTVAGGIQIGSDAAVCDATKAGTLRYNASSVEYCNGSSWQAFGVSGSGITSINGSSQGSQSFATPGATGTAPNWVTTTATGVHTLNIPMASASGVTAGLLSKTDYDAFNSKLGTSTSFSGDVSGTYNTTSVDKIKGTGVAITTLTTGNFLRFNGTNWVNAMLSATDIASGTLPISRGGTGATTADGALNNLLPSQTGNSGKVLSTDGTTTSWTTVTSSPAGTNGQVQFNNSGAFGASSNFFWDNTNSKLGIGTATPSFALSLGNGTSTDGSILSLGYGTVGTDGQNLTASGLGTRMMWYAKKAAFRAGSVDDTEWDDANIGLRSVAFGDSTKASGNYSFASGSYTTASDDGATALGDYSTASGISSVVIGSSNTASNSWAVAIGQGNIASGNTGVALGSGSRALSTYGVALGRQTTADSYAQVSVGRNNLPIGTESATTWVATDPIFVIGNGTGTGTSRSNAMIVLKNGKVGIGTNSPLAQLDVATTGLNSAMIIPRATTANRPSTPVNGMIRYNTTTAKFEGYQNGAWTDLIGTGTVTSVTGTAPVVVTGTTAPVVSMAQSNGTTDGYLSSTDWTTFNSKLGTSLTSANIFVGDSSNIATPVAASGDVTLSNTGAFTVTKLQGRSVSTTAPSIGSFLKWNDTLSNWEPTLFTNCNGASEVLHYILLTDTWSCDTLSINSLLPSQTGNSGRFLTTNGTSTSWGTVSASPAGANGQIQFNNSGAFGASSNLFWDNTNSRLGIGGGGLSSLSVSGGVSVGSTYVSFAAPTNGLIVSGNVGIGTNAPGRRLEIQGGGNSTYQIQSSSLASPAPNSMYPSMRVHAGSGDNYGAFYEFAANNSSAIPQSAYIGAVSQAGASVYSPNIVIGQQTGSTAYSERFRIDSVGNVGIGTAAPQALLEIAGTGDKSALLIPRDSQFSRPTTPINGMIRYNTSLNKFEGYEGGAWKDFISSSGMTGSGTTNTVPMFTGASALGDSPIVVTSGRVSIGPAPTYASQFAIKGPNPAMTIEDSDGAGVAATGQISFRDSAGSEYARIGDGNIGNSDLLLQSSTGGIKLTVFGSQSIIHTAGGAERMRLDSSGNLGIGTNAPSEKLHVIGNILASGTITPSDRRLKKNFATVENALEKINTLQTVTYDWREPEKHGSARQLGVIAQEVQKAFPEAVTKTDDGFLAVSYTSLISPVIAAVKELHVKVLSLYEASGKQNSHLKEVSREIASMKKENKELKEENAMMKSYLCKKDPTAPFCI
ncbi:MAG: tail fiber domain-containing protein [Bacteriovoracia bacterium]